MFGNTSYNVTFFGHKGVGKSSIINGSNDKKSSLLQPELTTKTISRNGVEIEFTVKEFDPGALKQIRTIGGLAFSAHCFVIVCDITSKEAVASLDIWLKEININTENNAKNIPLVVIGNKIDNQDKKETITKRMEEWCVKQNAKFFKINAKEQIETEIIFLELCKIIQKHDVERTKSFSNSDEPFQIEKRTHESYDPHNDSLNKSFIDSDKPHNYSVIVIGASGTGKTLLSKRFVDRSNWIDAKSKTKCTTAPDFFQTTREHKGETIRLQIWDTAGQERFQSILGSYYRKAECCLIVFDVTDRASFDCIDQLRAKLLEHVSEEKVSIILVGNKTDGTKENNITNLARRWYKTNNAYGYYEVSAQDNVSIDPLLEAILESCSLRLPMLKDSKKLNQSSNKSRKWGCC